MGKEGTGGAAGPAAAAGPAVAAAEAGDRKNTEPQVGRTMLLVQNKRN